MYFLMQMLAIVFELAAILLIGFLLRNMIRKALLSLNPKNVDKKIEALDASMIVLAIVFPVVLILVSLFWLPDEGEFNTKMAHWTGYPVTHLTFDTTAESDLDKKRLIHTLTPMMQKYRNNLDYHVGGGRGDWGGGHTVRVTIPSRYRFTGTRLEIITGSPISKSENSMLIATLEAAAMGEHPLPERLMSDMQADGLDDMEIALDPTTAQILSRRIIADERLQWKRDQCFLSVKGLLEPEKVLKLYAKSTQSKDAVGQLRVRDSSILENTEFTVVAVDADARRRSLPQLIKDFQGNKPTIYISLSLVPTGVDTIGEGCDKALVSAIGPKWVASAVNHDTPVLSHFITTTRIESISRFSPGDMGEGWTEVADNR